MATAAHCHGAKHSGILWPPTSQAQEVICHPRSHGSASEEQTHTNEAWESDSYFGMPVCSPIMSLTDKGVGHMSLFPEASLPLGKKLCKVFYELGIRAQELAFPMFTSIRLR